MTRTGDPDQTNQTGIELSPLTTDEYRFKWLPKPLVMGEIAVCPRCKGRTKLRDYEGIEGRRHADPYTKSAKCRGCNGFGLVPNIGPIPMATD